MALRVYQVNDVEWWVGDCTAEELLEAYMQETGVSREEALGDDDPGALPRELTDPELDRLKFHEEDGSVRTFREQLKALAEAGPILRPELFASTEY